jgi:hypothetical protein
VWKASSSGVLIRKPSTGDIRLGLVGAVASVFRLLARVRRGRAVHKVGRTFGATFTCRGGAASGIAVFDRPGTYPAL